MSKKPVVLMVLDGYGLNDRTEGNAIAMANTPVMDKLMKECPFQKGYASGLAVGLPDGQMGNSEVGHNAIGCGQIYSQGAKLVNESIESGKMYESNAWKELVANVKGKNSTMHFIGLLSDGNVHSNIKHLFNMIR